MASDDALEMADEWLRGRVHFSNHATSSPARRREIRLVYDLAAEVRELRRDKAMAFRLMRSREDRLSAIRDCVRQNKGDDLVRVEVEYLLDCPYGELDAAMGAIENG